jgi:acetyl-CoA acetyltransferase
VGILPAGVAAEALDAGLCNTVVLCHVMSTARPIGTPVIEPEGGWVGGPAQWEVPYGLGYTMQRVGLMARRYIHRYHVTEEQIGWLCIVQREGALLNPHAVMKRPLTMEEYLNSRYVSVPLRLFDCDLPINGAYAFVMTRGDRARDLRHPPAYFLGWADPKEPVAEHYLAEITEGLSPVARTLYADTGLSPRDIDVAFPYDGFSWFVPKWLENMGLVGRGEGGAFMEGGDRIRITGELPINTFGGNLSEGRMHGHGHILEAVQQVRGTAGPRQVKRANYAMVMSAFSDTGGAGIIGRA